MLTKSDWVEGVRHGWFPALIMGLVFGCAVGGSITVLERADNIQKGRKELMDEAVQTGHAKWRRRDDGKIVFMWEER